MTPPPNSSLLSRKQGRRCGAEATAWTEMRGWPVREARQGDIPGERAARQEEQATGPGKAAGGGWTWGRGGGVQGRSLSLRGSGGGWDGQPKARAALSWLTRLLRVIKGCLFSASGGVSVSPQGRALDHSFYSLCSPPKEKKTLNPSNRTRGRAGDWFPPPRGEVPSGPHRGPHGRPRP